MRTIAALLLLLLPALLRAQELLEYHGTATPPTVHATDTQHSFRASALVVNDRSETWTLVPGELSGLPRLLTARADRQLGPAGAMYVVSLPAAGTVYLPLDTRYGAGNKATWMGDEWTDSGLTCNSNFRPGWRIWKRAVVAGLLPLGTDTGVYDGVCFVFELEDSGPPPDDTPPDPPPPDPDPDPQPQPLVVKVNPNLRFTHSGLDTAGNTETLADCLLAIAEVNVDLSAGGPPLKTAVFPVRVGENVIPLTGFYTGIEDGSYYLWLLVRDTFGNESTWAKSEPFDIYNLSLSIVE